MPDVTLPNAQQPLGTTPNGQPVMIDRTWLQMLNALQKEVNDLRSRVTALE